MPSDLDPRSLAARRRGQIQTLRTRVATIGVAAFLALWGVLFVQVATGHDPGLSSSSPAAIVQSADPAATDTSSTAGSDAAGDDGGAGSAASASADSGSDAGAVTTRQS